jgi:hypothetical protein
MLIGPTQEQASPVTERRSVKTPERPKFTREAPGAGQGS